MTRQRRDVPWSHRTPDRCKSCGTDDVTAGESSPEGTMCWECYGERHYLHALFHAGCYHCWEQFREDRRLFGGSFLRES